MVEIRMPLILISTIGSQYGLKSGRILHIFFAARKEHAEIMTENSGGELAPNQWKLHQIGKICTESR
jgi:hypothetical protein